VKDWDAHVFHVFPVMCDDRDALQLYLKENDIHTMIHYPLPPHKQDAFVEWNHLSFPITEDIHKKELSLPVSPVFTLSDAAYVCNCINNFKK